MGVLESFDKELGDDETIGSAKDEAPIVGVNSPVEILAEFERSGLGHC